MTGLNDAHQNAARFIEQKSFAGARHHVVALHFRRFRADDSGRQARQRREHLPAESEIAARYGVNRHTVRRAMAELAERGMVYAERGSGTYVKTDKLDYRIGQRTRFSEIVAAAGHEAEGRLQGHRLEPASDEIARRLGLERRRCRCAARNRACRRPRPDIGRHDMALGRALPRCGENLPPASLDHAHVGPLRDHSITGGNGPGSARHSRMPSMPRRLRLSVHRPVLVVESLDVASKRCADLDHARAICRRPRRT